MPILMVLFSQQPWQTTSASSNCPHSVLLLLGQSTSPSSSPVQFTKLKTTGKVGSLNTASLPAIAPENNPVKLSYLSANYLPHFMFS